MAEKVGTGQSSPDGGGWGGGGARAEQDSRKD